MDLIKHDRRAAAERALALAEQLRDPNYPELSVIAWSFAQQGMHLYLSLGDVKRAMEVIRQRLRDEPTDVNACYWLGVTYIKGGNADKGLKIFQALIRVIEDDLVREGVLPLSSSMDMGKKLQTSTQALAKLLLYANLCYHIACFRLLEGDFEEAAQLLHRSYIAEPEHPRWHSLDVEFGRTTHRAVMCEVVNPYEQGERVW